MKIKTVALKRFKRFTDLTIQGLPETAKLIILAGPNGCGKSSFFDALNVWHRINCRQLGAPTWNDYYAKQLSGPMIQSGQAIQIEFYSEPRNITDKKKAIYVRSAYRNDPAFQIKEMRRMPSAIDENRIERIIDNDATVSTNYKRLVSQGIEDLYHKSDAISTIGDYREKSIGRIRDAMRRLFPDLILTGLGNPLADGTFHFDKGDSCGFKYSNLSGGEKSAFDLLLDLMVKKDEYDNTIFCIDEPEAHMNTRLQSQLLEEIYRHCDDDSQIWLATHSIGMMRRARDLEREIPGTVCFMDFDGKDFDLPQTLTPIITNRVFWKRVLNVALDDLSELVAPKRVVICEGAPNVPGSGRNAGLDAKCYDRVFESEFPDTRFLSAGNAHSVQTDRLALMEAIKALVDGSEVVRLVDRDDRSADEVEELARSGVRVLSRRNLECYLFDDEVLRALCEKIGKMECVDPLLADKAVAVQNAIGRGASADNLKLAAGEIYNAAKHRLQLVGCGNDAKAFMRETLGPLVQPGMKVYDDLKRDIFD